MSTVAEAAAAFDAVTNRKNATDAALIDALAKESDLRSQIGRLIADGAKPEAVDAIRSQRDQARQDVEDLEAAVGHLEADVAVAAQAVHQARVSEARGVMRKQAPAARDSAKQLEQAVRDVATFRGALIAAGSKMRAAALTAGHSNPGRFGMELLTRDVIQARLVDLGGPYAAPVPTLVAATLQDAEAL